MKILVNGEEILNCKHIVVEVELDEKDTLKLRTPVAKGIMSTYNICFQSSQLTVKESDQSNEKL